jgi:phosphate:Na+ symporter
MSAPDPSVAVELEWGTLAMGLFGGLALFLYGMDKLGDALKVIAGDKMKSILAALSNKRFVGMISGAVTTGIVQSSSVTTVMLVGFVSAGLMTMSQSIGVIFGAKLGTTVTAQIVAFKVTKFALVLVAAGFFLSFIAKREKIRQWGATVMGLGLIFFGMAVMSKAMYPLRSFQPFVDLMGSMENPAAGMLVAALFTAVVQSSSATMGIVVVLAMQGLLTLEAGIALALGANIGTCMTAGLASIGKPREAVRVAVAHLIYSLAIAVVALPFLPLVADAARAMSPVADATLTGQDMLAKEVPRQVANAHTIINGLAAFLFLPLTGFLARLVTRLVPDKPDKAGDEFKAKHLDDLLIETPGMALVAVRREINRMGKRVRTMLDDSFDVVMAGGDETLMALGDADEEVDALYGQIVTYLGKLSARDLTEGQTAELMNLTTAANEIESIGDVIENELVNLGQRRYSSGVVVSKETSLLLGHLHEMVSEAFRLALKGMKNTDPKRARDVLGYASRISDLSNQIEMHQVERLTADAPERLTLYSLELDVLDRLRRIYQHANRLARKAGGLTREHLEGTQHHDLTVGAIPALQIDDDDDE